MISRRQFLQSSGLAAAAVLLSREIFATSETVSLPGMVQKAKERAANAKISVQKLRGNVWALTGAGGNIAVLAGKDGKLLVDAGYAVTKPKILDALAGISADPVRHLVNTHWHFDHTDGNEWLHSEGARIVAHENTRKHLSLTTEVKFWEYTFPPAPTGALPAEVFTDKKQLHLNGDNLELQYCQPAHTDGDIAVYFTQPDILHAGDTFWNGYYPFIDYSTGGNIDGMIRATERNLAQASANTIIIPGHGAVADKAQLNVYRDMLVAIRERVAALKKQGKSLDEAIAAKPTAAFDEKWGGGLPPSKFAGLVYQGV